LQADGTSLQRIALSHRFAAPPVSRLRSASSHDVWRIFRVPSLLPHRFWCGGVRPSRSVAAHWHCRSPLDLFPLPGGPPGVFLRAPSHRAIAWFEGVPRDLASSSERPSRPGSCLLRLPAACASCLSWDSFDRVNTPPPTCLAASTPRDVAATLGRQVPPCRHVPPAWFLTTSTVCSACQVPGLLHPGTGRGSRRC